MKKERAAKPRTPIEHTHDCKDCGHVWACLEMVDKPNRKTCPVDDAAKVNKQGPFCSLCYHVEMAKRYAQLRGIVLQVAWPAVRE